ncbi:MAG: hypothetical protein QF441_03190 [Bacteriovoracaceae bacterium]|jgi:long-subunit fatty acid transport protein|nr:hypothetical protein [Bacteriovoracaceae bacterium]
MKKLMNIATVLALSVSSFAVTEIKAEDNIVKDTVETIKNLNDSGLYRPHFALMGGYSDPVENGYESSELIALEVGYQVLVPYGIGLEISTQEFENDSEADLTQTQFFLKGSYHFAGDIQVIKNSYVGLGVGFVQENSNSDSTYGAIMPNIGFDIPLNETLENLSFGANARYTASASNEVDNFALNGVVKYWF